MAPSKTPILDRIGWSILVILSVTGHIVIAHYLFNDLSILQAGYGCSLGVYSSNGKDLGTIDNEYVYTDVDTPPFRCDDSDQTFAGFSLRLRPGTYRVYMD